MKAITDYARESALFCPVHKTVECESCREGHEHTPATHRSDNPEFSGYLLCQECAAEYDSRMKTT